jgi:hypothetical protein
MSKREPLDKLIGRVTRHRGLPPLRQRFMHTRGLVHAPPQLVQGVGQSLETMGALIPGSRPRLRQVGLELPAPQQSMGPGGWFVPGKRLIRLTPRVRSAPFVTHQAIHALDFAAGPGGAALLGPPPWASATKGTSAHRLAAQAREVVRDHLMAYADEIVLER